MLLRLGYIEHINKKRSVTLGSLVLSELRTGVKCSMYHHTVLSTRLTGKRRRFR